MGHHHVHVIVDDKCLMCLVYLINSCRMEHLAREISLIYWIVDLPRPIETLRWVIPWAASTPWQDSDQRQKAPDARLLEKQNFRPSTCHDSQLSKPSMIGRMPGSTGLFDAVFVEGGPCRNSNKLQIVGAMGL